MQFGQIERIWFEELPLPGSVHSFYPIDLHGDEDGETDQAMPLLKSDTFMQPHHSSNFILHRVISTFHG